MQQSKHVYVQLCGRRINYIIMYYGYCGLSSVKTYRDHDAAYGSEGQ